jgi:hypothetical protein
MKLIQILKYLFSYDKYSKEKQNKCNHKYIRTYSHPRVCTSFRCEKCNKIQDDTQSTQTAISVSVAGLPTENWLIKVGFENDSYSNFNIKIDSELWITVSFSDYDCKIFKGVSLSDIDLKHINNTKQIQDLYIALSGHVLIEH